MHTIAVFTEGFFDSFYTRSTLPEARAFAEGMRAGAGKYGCGDLGAYVLGVDDDEADMAKNEVDEWIQFMRKKLAEQVTLAKRS
jgi:hypothetical protein